MEATGTRSPLRTWQEAVWGAGVRGVQVQSEQIFRVQ